MKQPREILKGTHLKYNFNCTLCNHIFNTSIYSIVSLNTWCPFCANQQLCDKEECKQCFEKSFASHEKAKFWSNKNDVKPRYIFSKTKAIYIFNCNICNHEFNMNTETINKGSWCQYCLINMLCEKKECKICFEKSLASHPKSKYWSNKNKILPYQVSKGSDNKYLFDCDTCLHTFEISIGTITRNNAWCNFCANRKLCKNNNCKICFEKSFASHPKSKYWSNKNELKSREVFLNDNDKYIFFCDVCNHDSIRPLCSINNNQHCLYCVIPSKLLCDNEDCKKCFERSFASHEKAKYWSSKNDVTPRYVSKCNGSKFIFICEKKHKFEKSLNKISGKNNGWCPFCVNKTEQKLFEQLIKLYPTLQQQFKVAWCKKTTYLPFDFIIPEHNIIIELDGRQHFEQVSTWSSPEEQNINDKYKMKCANKNKYSVIRILQEDVFYDTYDWINELNQNIKKIINEKIIQNIYMCKDNEYSVFDIQSVELEV
jgi:very-short-patch-repair endonuclease